MWKFASNCKNPLNIQQIIATTSKKNVEEKFGIFFIEIAESLDFTGVSGFFHFFQKIFEIWKKLIFCEIAAFHHIMVDKY